ncbi:NADH-quinone oxidoreductase subunit NuoG [Arsenophonus sp.]|uniref:NADH-quinone oxidoreductase subunit NuoG n=1 Tax=Arsenophonus sp. TaxID=1872640 RepID=UPI0028650BE5|nr:NADH-quinone oxidoreductase subunit NuoG [Arsenophonus sp.]MDR5617822.1 NADH-quinone oxidoreductase subunit NuoG [Arsenophonus sp.]
MVKIYLNGKQYNVNENNNLLHGCLSLGFDIPYFCWHPALGSVGACRQCAVKQYHDANDTQGRLVMSCMTAVSNGMYISIDDDEAKQFRKNVIEWLMTNHPHDCPVCEEGGNCHLQDMTVMAGHTIRKYRFAKKTYQNQYLGPFINHEMNRCITCYRCIRYYKDYADGTDLGVYGTKNNVYFGRVEDGILESEFSGNLVEICPTGVFTDKTSSKIYNRKWDLQFAPGICQQCSIGCNTILGERHGKICKIENRYNGMVNHYFLCDRGRFGYGYVNRQDRPLQPQVYKQGIMCTISVVEAIKAGSKILHQAKKTIGIGSPRASIESNYALRSLVGAENFYSGISIAEQRRLELMVTILQNGGVYTPTLCEIENYDAILVLGEDLTQTGARVALALRQAVKKKAKDMAKAHKVLDWQIAAVLNIGQNSKYPLFITNIDNTCLDDVAALSYFAPVDDQARFGFSVAHVLDKNAPATDNLPADIEEKVHLVSQALLQAQKPLIISGSNSGSDSLIQAAANIAFSLKNNGVKPGITYIASEANSFGLALMHAKPLDMAMQLMISGEIDVAVVMENDLYRHSDVDTVTKGLSKINRLIVADHQRTSIMQHADLILPAASFAESSGTLINNEGRAQRYFQVFDPKYYKPDININSSWRWFHLLQTELGTCQINWVQLDNVIHACIKDMPQFSPIVDAAPNATFRISGQKLSRSPHRYSSRTAILADREISEPGQPCDINTPFAFSMEGNNSPMAIRQHIPFAWSPGWNSPQAWNKFQDKVGGHLRFGDPGIRLFNSNNSFLDYFTDIPPKWKRQDNQWIVAPYYHLFGSDETSQRATVIQQRMPEVYIMLNMQDAKILSVKVGDILKFSYGEQNYQLPVRFSNYLAQGQIGLPLGMPDISPTMVGGIIKNLRRIT